MERRMRMTMNPGMRYEVLFRLEGQKKTRRMVAKFLAKEQGKLYFDLRPAYGTTELREEDMVMYRDTVEPIAPPVIYKGGE
jgi:hypothetical protein